MILLAQSAEQIANPWFFLKEVNASLNTLATILIVVGFIAIKQGKEGLHKKCMLAAAAVSDYRPADCATQKIKKSKETTSIELVPSEDILASVAALDGAPFTVGFAAETEKVDEYARSKLENKRLDMIIANRVGVDRGFDADDNAVNVIWDGCEKRFERSRKSELADRLIELVAERYNAVRGGDTKDNVIAIH